MLRPPPTFAYYLALRYLLARWINLISVLGIGLSVWAMIAVVAVLSGFIEGPRRGIEDASPDLLLSSLPADADYAVLQPLLQEVEGVAHTAPRLHHHAMLLPHGGPAQLPTTVALQSSLSGTGKFVMLCGVDAQAEEAVIGMSAWFSGLDEARPGMHGEIGRSYRPEAPTRPFTVSPGRIDRARQRLAYMRDGGLGPRPEPSGLVRPQAGVVVGFDRIKYGDTLLPGQRLSLLSLIRDGEGPEAGFRKVRIGTYLSGAFVNGHKLFNSTVCLMDIHELRNYLGPDPMLGLGPEQWVTDVAIKVREGASIATVKQGIRAALQAAELAPDPSLLDWREQNATYLNAVDLERSMMTLSLAAVMLVACFLIFVTLHMMVTQKTKDIGTLTSLGATASGISSLFLLSGLAIGLVGAGGGLLGGYLTTAYINDIDRLLVRWFGSGIFPDAIYSLKELPVDTDPVWMLQVASAALLLSLMVAWWPAHKAARQDPVKALMHY